MSVVALVTPWRNELHPGQLDSQGLVLQTGFPDPRWYVSILIIIVTKTRAFLTSPPCQGVLASMLHR